MNTWLCSSMHHGALSLRILDQASPSFLRCTPRFPILRLKNHPSGQGLQTEKIKYLSRFLLPLAVYCCLEVFILIDFSAAYYPSMEFMDFQLFSYWILLCVFAIMAPGLLVLLSLSTVTLLVRVSCPSRMFNWKHPLLVFVILVQSLYLYTCRWVQKSLY